MMSATFIFKEKLAKDTWVFVFSCSSLEFIPGQFTTLILGNDSRDFTICPTGQKNTFAIITKKSETPFKQALFSLNKGTKIQIKEPVGGFTLRANNKPKVFLAGGVGLVPFYAMLMQGKYAVPITLVATFTTKGNMFFYDRLTEIETKQKNVHVVYSLTKEKWDKETGRISLDMIKKHVPAIAESEFYIAGGVDMVEATEEILRSLGVSSTNIIIDIFTGY